MAAEGGEPHGDSAVESLGDAAAAGAPNSGEREGESAAEGSSDDAADPMAARRPCAASPETWESVGRRAVALLLEDALDELSRETHLATSDVRHGESITEDHFQRLRAGVEVYQLVVEDILTELSPAVEPYERTVGRIPARQLRRALDGHSPERTDSADASRDGT